jgi:hypothetical protein
MSAENAAQTSHRMTPTWKTLPTLPTPFIRAIVAAQPAGMTGKSGKLSRAGTPKQSLGELPSLQSRVATASIRLLHGLRP